LLEQGCPFEFFRVQRSTFNFFSTYTFLSVRSVQMFLNALYYFYKKINRGSLNIAKEQKFDIFEKEYAYDINRQKVFGKAKTVLPKSEKVFQYSVITCLECTLCTIFVLEKYGNPVLHALNYCQIKQAYYVLL
jgi:hypothetical protein